MPLPTAKLNRRSSRDEVRSAISATIEQQIHEGKKPKQAVAIALESARNRGAGHHIPKKVKVVRRKGKKNER